MPKFVVFCRHFDQKQLKVGYTVSLTKNFQRQNCRAINYLWNGINILAGGDPVPVKFEPKCTDSIGWMCVSRFTRGALSSRR